MFMFFPHRYHFDLHRGDDGRSMARWQTAQKSSFYRNRTRSHIKHKNFHNNLSNWGVSLAIAGIINYFTN